MDTQNIVLTCVIFLVALLYSSVGHGGASGYLAALGMAGESPALMRPAALILNVLVAGMATVRFARAGYLRWATFWPFAITSVPFAFYGGRLSLPGVWYKAVLGVVLVLSALRMLMKTGIGAPKTTDRVPVIPAMGCGGALGLLSGLTGVGGGIFLSPLLLFLKWTEMRQTAATSAAFILVNSLAGLAGRFSDEGTVAWPVLPWIIAAGIGGAIGSRLGSRRLATDTIKKLLAGVLLLGGSMLIRDAVIGFSKSDPSATSRTAESLTSARYARFCTDNAI